MNNDSILLRTILYMITIPLLLLAVGETSLVALLIWLLIFMLVVWLVFFILSRIPLPEPWRTVITAIVGLILLLVLLRQFGFV
jgi:hypothetical protein